MGTRTTATILIIETDADLRDLIAEVLRGVGYAAVAVADHVAARGALARARHDLILADTAGPRAADPWAALEGVRAAAGTTPVLICSAHQPATFAGYAARGYAGLVAKPFGVDDLAAVVRDTLAAAAWRTGGVAVCG